MEISTMGKVAVPAKIENLTDLWKVDEGILPADEVRSLEVSDAVVDTAATFLSMPRRMIATLGLRPFQTRSARTTAGVREVPIYGLVRLTIQGRQCRVDVAELPDDCPVLIGQLPLEQLDFIVDPVGQRLLGNPDHGGEQMLDLL